MHMYCVYLCLLLCGPVFPPSLPTPPLLLLVFAVRVSFRLSVRVSVVMAEYTPLCSCVQLSGLRA